MISSELRGRNICVPVPGRTGRDPTLGRINGLALSRVANPAACKNCSVVGRDWLD
jgi:hypothetical protein